MKLQGILLKIFLFVLQATPMMGGMGGGDIGNSYRGSGCLTDVSRNKRSPIRGVENKCLGLACGNLNVDLSRNKRSPMDEVQRSCLGFACANVNNGASIVKRGVSISGNYRGAGCTTNYVFQNVFRNKRSPVRDVENYCKGAACAHVNVDLSINRRSPMHIAKNSCTGFSCSNTCIGIECENIESDGNEQLSNGGNLRRQILMKKV